MKPVSVLLHELNEKDVAALPDGWSVLVYDTLYGTLSIKVKGMHFKHFVEIEDSEGNAIRVDGKKFLENAAEYDLSPKEMRFLRDKVLNHSRQSQENRSKILILKKKKPRD